MSTAPTMSVYDGQRLLGHIIERGREYSAYSWTDEILIGTYGSRKEAAEAISAAALAHTSPGERR
jgi:hypothetical protein